LRKSVFRPKEKINLETARIIMCVEDHLTKQLPLQTKSKLPSWREVLAEIIPQRNVFNSFASVATNSQGNQHGKQRMKIKCKIIWLSPKIAQFPIALVQVWVGFFASPPAEQWSQSY